jgi:3-methylcrotonyl-CoA carboxylase alpha subunit
MKVTINAQVVDVTPGQVTVAGQVYRVENGAGGEVLVNGNPLKAQVSVDGAHVWVTLEGRTYRLKKAAGGRKTSGHGGHAAGELSAPMPGLVQSVSVSQGEAVSKGQTILVLVAMKMEIRIAAPFDGTLASLRVKAGDTVEKEQVLGMVESRP